MLHILFILLKIIGILLAAALGLFLLVLLMPVCYSVQIDKKEEEPVKGQIRVTWFCSLLWMKASYIDKIFDYRIRVFGYQIAGNQKDFVDRKKRKEEKKEEKRRRKENAAVRNESKQQEKSFLEEVNREEEEKREIEINREEYKELAQTKEVSEETEKISGQPKSSSEEEEGITGQVKVPSEKEEEINGQKKEARKEKKKKNRKNYREIIRENYCSLRNNIEKIGEIYETCGGQALKNFLWESLLQLGRHVLPRRWKGYLHFGFSDPATTGIFTGVVALVYPFGQKSFSLEPDFQQACFDTTCLASGRIQPGFFVWMAVKVLGNKNVRLLLNYGRKAGEKSGSDSQKKEKNGVEHRENTVK